MTNDERDSLLHEMNAKITTVLTRMAVDNVRMIHAQEWQEKHEDTHKSLSNKLWGLLVLVIGASLAALKELIG